MSYMQLTRPNQVVHQKGCPASIEWVGLTVMSVCFVFRPSWSDGHFPPANAPVPRLPINPVMYFRTAKLPGHCWIIDLAC